MNIDSPFEQWRLKYMKGMAASRDIMELLAANYLYEHEHYDKITKGMK